MRQTAYDGSGPWVLDLEQSDPRVSGRLEGSLEEIGRATARRKHRLPHAVHPDQPGRSLGGAPVARRCADPARGSSTSSTPDFLGSGAYEGLFYRGFWHFMERRRLAPGDTWVWAGWIEEKE